MDVAILQSCSKLSDVLKRCFASRRVNAPVFPRLVSQRSGSSSPSIGGHYNSETAGTSCWLPRTWHVDDNLGICAEYAAPRNNAPRDSGRLERVRTPETRGQACWSRTLPVATQPREGADPSLHNQTCLLRATPACCKFAGPAPHIYKHRSASSQRNPRYRLSPFLVFPASLELLPRACILESRP